MSEQARNMGGAWPHLVSDINLPKDGPSTARFIEGVEDQWLFSSYEFWSDCPSPNLKRR